MSGEEVGHLTALFVSRGAVVDLLLRLVSQVLTLLRDGEDNLLHGAVLSHNLHVSEGVTVKENKDILFLSGL